MIKLHAFLGPLLNGLDAVDSAISNFYFDAIEAIKTRDDFSEYEGREFLLGPFINLKNRNAEGLAPIHHAIKTGNKLAFEWLMQNPRVDVNVTLLSEIESWNPAHCAIVYKNPFALEELMKAGVQINQKDSAKMTPLAYLEDDLSAKSLLFKIIDAEEFDLSAKIGDFGRSYSHFWARDSTLNVLGHALNRDSSLLGPSDSNGVTPLMVAAENGQEATVKMLLSRGASYKARDSRGRSALHRAAASGNAQICKSLLFALEDAQWTSIEGTPTPLSFDQTLSTDEEGMSPLMEAVSRSHLEVIEVLLDLLHPDSDSDSASDSFLDLHSSKTGDTALHLAVKADSSHNQLEMVRLLLKKGAFADAVNFEGKKPVDYANSQEIIDALQFDV